MTRATVVLLGFNVEGDRKTLTEKCPHLDWERYLRTNAYYTRIPAVAANSVASGHAKPLVFSKEDEPQQLASHCNMDELLALSG